MWLLCPAVGTINGGAGLMLWRCTVNREGQVGTHEQGFTAALTLKDDRCQEKEKWGRHWHMEGSE